jgi:ABC-type transport system substrate-binding protein
MYIKRILIVAPVVVILLLLQSYYWVPTYEQQTRGNPQRLGKYINASTGDASILNPILSADSASSTIEGMVFEGLLDRDEDLRFRGRLATSWDIYEEAYFYINPRAEVPGRGRLGAQATVDLLHAAQDADNRLAPDLAASLANIREISMVTPLPFTHTLSIPGPTTPGTKRSLQAEVTPPVRIRLRLQRVDQDLFNRLSELLGQAYFSAFPAERYVKPLGDATPQDLAPYLNQILPATEHNPVILFRLRPGVYFHDGHRFDAADVKFTYDAIMNPKNLSPRTADYEPVKSVQIIDPLTVRIVYKRLYSPAIGTWGIGILPEHLLNATALQQEARERGRPADEFGMRQSRFSRNPVGCGPFVFREWKSDQFIVLDRFEDYWEGPANYTQYILRIIPDLLTQEMEFYAGTIDTYGVQPHQVERLRDDLRFQHFSGTAFGYTYIGYNLRRPPFDDRRVRTALGMAIDVNKILDYVLHGQGEPITGPFVKQTDYYNHDIQPLPYDPQGALALLKAAGWTPDAEGWLTKDGRRLQFTLITNSGNDLRKAILAIAQDAWKQIGIDVRTDLLEWSVFIQERVNKLDFDALILGWSMGIEPDLFQIWHSSQTGPFQLNFVGFDHPQADDLILRIRREYNHAQQVAYSHRLHEIIANEQPYTFLYVGRWTAVLDKRILIKETDPSGAVLYKPITPTKTGSYSFHFNKWVKVPEMPTLSPGR